MKCTDFKFRGFDGKEIFASKYLCDEPKAIVQIAHGMAEHRKRYDEFAKKLCEEGYLVYINDHRGHGETAKDNDELGFFDEEDGWNKALSDMYKLTQLIKDEYPNLPICVFGHSMGSFLTRTYITKYSSEIDAAIICGTGQLGAGFLNILILLAKIEAFVKGNKGKSKLIEKMLFMFNNVGLKPRRTKYDWLSRDTDIVDKYVDDDWCGFNCTTSFYKDLLSGMKYLAKRNNNITIRNDLPLYFISGDKDPVGNIGYGIKKIVESYRSAGLSNVTYKTYSECRHEILNEINKEEVYEDIIKWINDNIKILSNI